MKGPSKRTVKKLQLLSHNRCSKPGCPNLLVQKDGVIGHIHHIAAKSPHHPDYDANLTDEQRHGFDNLLLLCPNCHDKVHDNPEGHPVSLLFDWKAQHENPEQYQKALTRNRLAGGEEALPLSPVDARIDKRVTGYVAYLTGKVSTARERGNLTMLREHLEMLAHVHETERAWGPANITLRELYDIYLSLADYTQIIRVARRLGYALLRTRDVKAARQALRNGVLALRRLPHGTALKPRAQLFELLGMAYLRDGLPKRALRCLREKALPDRKLLKAPLGIASTLSRMGLVYSALGEPDKSLASILDGLQIRFSTEAKTDTGRSLRSLGIVHQDEEELVLAAFVFRISLRWQEGCRGRVAQARAHLDLAEVFKDILIKKHRMIDETTTFRQFPFPNQREKSLLIEIIEESCPKEMDATLSASQFSTLAHFHYCECLRLAGGRLDKRILRTTEARLAMLDNTFSPL